MLRCRWQCLWIFLCLVLGLAAANAAHAKTLKTYYPDGVVQSDQQVGKDSAGRWRKHGRFRAYLKDGSLCLTGEFHKGRPSGRWLAWDKDHRQLAEMHFDKGRPKGPAWRLDPASGKRLEFQFSKKGRLKGGPEAQGHLQALLGLGFPLPPAKD